MKFTPSPIAGGMSGSAGSLVASHNRYGFYFRNRVTPVNPNSTRQQAVRSLFGSLVNYWTNTLTAAQRQSWETYAVNTPLLGQDVTGQNMFIRSNIAHQLGGSNATIAAGPTIFDKGSPVTGIQSTVDGDPDLLALNNAETGLGTTLLINGLASADGWANLYVSAPINSSRNFFRGPYQLLAQVAVAQFDSTVDFTTILSAFQNATVPLVAGETRGISARVIYDDGRMPDSFNSIVTVAVDGV